MELNSGRDRIALGVKSSDLSWIEAAKDGDAQLLRNPLNLGQMINNRTTDKLANVSYIELDIEKENFSPEFLELLPNVDYSPTPTRRLCGDEFFQNFLERVERGNYFSVFIFS